MERISTGNSSVMPEARSLVTSEVKVNIGEFSQKMRAAKNKGRFSDAKLGRILGVSDKTVKAWIQEKSEPRMERRKEIHQKLDAILSDEPQGQTAEPESPTKPEPTPAPEVIESTPEAVDPIADRPKLRELLPGDRHWEV